MKLGRAYQATWPLEDVFRIESPLRACVPTQKSLKSQRNHVQCHLKKIFGTAVKPARRQIQNGTDPGDIPKPTTKYSVPAQSARGIPHIFQNYAYISKDNSLGSSNLISTNTAYSREVYVEKS